MKPEREAYATSDSFEIKEKYTIKDLVLLTRLLRSDNGCPWDREQNHHSIRKNFLEETYEVLEAIDTEDTVLLREELGDVLLQVVFHAELEAEAGSFNFDDVCDEICKKLVVRHPHVFSTVDVSGTDEVLSNWDKIKKETKKQDTYTETLKSVPVVLPALMRSQKVQHRAGKIGFCYPSVEDALKDLDSERLELQQAIENQDKNNIEEKLGNLLFSVVNVSEMLDVDPEQSLTKACEKFISRFEKIEELANAQSISFVSQPYSTTSKLYRSEDIYKFNGGHTDDKGGTY